MALPSDKMPFGKHKGTPINKLPTKYLKWMVKEFMGGDYDEFGKAALQVLKSPTLKTEASSEDLDQQATEFLRDHGFNYDADIKPAWKHRGRTRRRF